MALQGGGYPDGGGGFPIDASLVSNQNSGNPQTYPLQPNNSIVKLENPCSFSNLPVKVEVEADSNKVVFPPEFAQQNHQIPSSPSNGGPNENNANSGCTCDVCGKVCENRSLLTKHKVSHQPRDRICNICGRAFARDDKLKRHVQSVHSNERPFICDTCGKGFARKDKLQEHARHHNKNITFPCQMCTEVFNMKSKLNKHLRDVHRVRQSNREPGNSSNKKKKAKINAQTSASNSVTSPQPVMLQPTLQQSNNNISTGSFLQNPANLLWYQRQAPQSNPFDIWNSQNSIYSQHCQLYQAIRQNPQMFSQAAANPAILQAAAASAYWPPNFPIGNSITTDAQQRTTVASNQQSTAQNGAVGGTLANTQYTRLIPSSSYPVTSNYYPATTALASGQDLTNAGNNNQTLSQSQVLGPAIDYNYTQ